MARALYSNIETVGSYLVTTFKKSDAPLHSKRRSRQKTGYPLNVMHANACKELTYQNQNKP